MKMDLTLKNVCLRAGDQLEITGMIPCDANRFCINLGSSPDDLAFHFNPRFEACTEGALIVCNSLAAGCWGKEKRKTNYHLGRGTEVKLVFKMMEDVFKVELPDRQEVNFPNSKCVKVFSHVEVYGDLKLSSFVIR